VPLQLLQFRPGINREGTTLANEGGWFECDKIRFRSGYPQKIGGWAPISPYTYDGVARSLWNWTTLKGYNLVGVGTNTKYYLEDGGVYNDVTPIRETTQPGTVTFAATVGSSIITVTDQNNGVRPGDSVTFFGAVSLGGNITATVLNQEYIVSYVDPNTYTIDVGVLANSSDTGDGGTGAYAQYQINVGSVVYSSQTGWGAGLWGGQTYGAENTYLTSAINATQTTIDVASTLLFPASGIIQINGELISYGSKNLTQFLNCTRGYQDTEAPEYDLAQENGFALLQEDWSFILVNQSHDAGSVVYSTLTFRGWGQSQDTVYPRLWSQANFGDYLIVNPRGGALYMWVPEYTTSDTLVFNRAEELSYLNVAVLLQENGFAILQEDDSYILTVNPNTYQTDVDCPSASTFVMVSDVSRFVISFGCNDYGSGELDPLLIRWSAQDDYSTWTPSATNQAGSFRLSTGSKIVTAIQTRQEIIVLTDAACYSMQYLGPPYVWGFNIMSANISIIGPNAIAAANGIVYWMGVDKFYSYSGRVETLPCALRQYVYGDINTEQLFQCFAGANEGYSEIWWFYCSANSTVVDRYVIYNYLDKVWYYGTLERSAWLDSPLRDYPMGATYNHTIVYHENGTDDQEVQNVTLPINSYIQSSDFDIGDGHNFGFVWRIIPDLTFDGSNTSGLPDQYPAVTLTVRPRQNPGANYGAGASPTVNSAQSYAAQKNYTVQEFTEIVYTRIRGRQMAFKISSEDLGVQWQLGVPRIDLRPDGRR
jgi:hypothetical protein